MAQSRIEKRKYKWKKLLKLMTIVGVVAFFVLGGATIYLLNKVSNVTSNVSEELDRGDKSDMREVAVDPGKDNISILFLGVDDRDGELVGRTDAMLLTTFNKGEGTIKLTSIPRDALVEIPGRRNPDKINHAHAFGGTDLAIETVENLFDIPVDYFVKLNFMAFIEIVDALGGIEVDVPFTFSEMDSNDNQGAITLYEGRQLLSGEEALAFSRMRKKDPRGDLGRGDRQQEVIKAIIEKGASLSSITSYGAVLDSIEKHISMNLSFGNILSLHSYSGGLNDIESLYLEGNNRRINGVFYYELTEESIGTISTTFQEHLEIK
ncbi:LCP family glycopolymer transferase [Bacillus sp. FJAT-45350]|uniref:LCP family glycopolymer transferase n=1 Tax=Bacillus sp. FJAT-45350 TaxID=2011014 RepID=UPI000BB70841|nr:LCP family protein [Bacillus sp. FJAT-45350]